MHRDDKEKHQKLRLLQTSKGNSHCMNVVITH